MAFPTVYTKVAFASNPSDSPQVYTDISSYCRESHISRMRQYELDRMESGTWDGVLDNTDRRFDPTNTAGAYYPNVKQKRTLQQYAVVGGNTYYLFTGAVDAWPLSWNDPSYSEVAVRCYDLFEALSNDDTFAGNCPAELSGARLGRALTAFDANISHGNLGVGCALIQAADYTSNPQNYLDHLQTCTDTEGGVFRINGAGVPVFDDRSYRVTGARLTSKATFGDAASEIPYEPDIAPSFDSALLKNAWTISAPNLADQYVDDATSKTTYRKRAGSLDTLCANVNDMVGIAQARVFLYKDPALRFDSISVDIVAVEATTAGIWDTLLGLDISDRVTVKKTPPGGGARIIQDCFIEGVQDDIGPSKAWKRTFRLSPCNPATYWLVNVAGYGETGTHTWLGW